VSFVQIPFRLSRHLHRNVSRTGDRKAYKNPAAAETSLPGPPNIGYIETFPKLQFPEKPDSEEKANFWPLFQNRS
jgi:hypothetical protein